MKKLIFITIILIPSVIFAQKDDFTRNDLIGLWQINTPQIGSSLLEHFRFYKDGKFIYDYNTSDDTRNIINIDGKYRLEGKKLFLTITSLEKRVGGRIIAGGVGTDDYLFVYDNDSVKRIVEKSPQELDPLFIMKVNKIGNKINIFINNRHYYKISANPDIYKYERNVR